MLERRIGLIPMLKAGISGVIEKFKSTSQGEPDYSTPRLRRIPSPVDDPDGYERHFILRAEREICERGDEILNKGDLTPEVLNWARTFDPGDYTGRAATLHWIKVGWIKDNPVLAIENINGWKDLLEGDGWKKY